MHPIKQIRLKLGYSIRDFAELLNVKDATYQCYDNGTRKCPESVLKEAQAAYRRDRAFFRELPARVDKATPHGVPNLAVKGEW